MGELTAVRRVEMPNTRSSLCKELRELGLETGMTVIVHSSLSALGWVCGGAAAVVQALMDAVGEEGTLVMPAQTGDNSEPSAWQYPPVPEAWWAVIRREMPAYDPRVTPTRGMGAIAEAFRSFPGVRRSAHPASSFTAWGKHAEAVVAEQPLEAGFGPDSPLGKIYGLDGRILLLGVGHDNNTSLHLAEHAVPGRERVRKGAAVLEAGERVWKEYEEILYDSDPFPAIGQAFEEAHPVRSAAVGAAAAKLIRQRPLVDYARGWLQRG